MKSFVERRPFLFSVLLTAALFGLAVAGRAARPTAPVGSVKDLAPQELVPPSDLDQALTLLAGDEILFRLLAALLAIALLAWLGWWREAGFNRPSRWRNLHLLLFPFLVAALFFSGGVQDLGPALLGATLASVALATFGEEALYRGVAWRALTPRGLMRAVVVTAVLSGALRFGGALLSGPWPEAIAALILATCGGFTYAALRWRTASIWPVILLHLALNVAAEVSTPLAPVYLLVLLATTLGFVAYGLFLLRNARVRTDGG